MKRKNGLRQLAWSSLTLILLILVPRAGAAASVTFEFEGQVSSVSAPLAAALMAIDVEPGSLVSGRYSFESTTADAGAAGFASYTGALTSFELTIGGYRYIKVQFQN